MPTVLLTDSDLGDRRLEAEWLRSALEVDVVIENCRTEAEVLGAVRRHRPAAIICQWAPISAAVIEAAADCCRVISRCGIGLDTVDVDAATAVGIQVRNVPTYCIEEVASHAVGLGLNLWRRVARLDAELRAGVWEPARHASMIKRLSSSTVGLVGCGRIGTAVGRAFAAWGTTIIATDPVGVPDGFEPVGLGELAARSDLISLHVPLSRDTRHIIGTDFIARTRRRPIIVNTSRGGLIDENAAATGIREGRLSGLGLDVYSDEPLPATSPLRELPNTVLTPHAAWCSAEALPDLRRGAVANVIDVLTRSAADDHEPAKEETRL